MRELPHLSPPDTRVPRRAGRAETVRRFDFLGDPMPLLRHEAHLQSEYNATPSGTRNGFIPRTSPLGFAMTNSHTKAAKRVDVPDVRADEPERAMEQFTDGLRRVLNTPKPIRSKRSHNHRKRSKAG